MKLEEEYLADIFKRVADKYEVDVKYVIAMHDDLFRNMKLIMQTPMMPEIRINRWGTYTPKLNYVNTAIGKYIRDYNMGYLSYESACCAISELWPVRQKLIKEKLKRNKHDRRFRKCKQSSATDQVA